MPDNDARSREDEYFWKKDQELIAKMRRTAEVDTARREMGARVGLQDPELVNELEALGFTPETVVLLPLVPLVQIAWAEGGVSNAERQLIVKLARARGVADATPADRQLAAWLDSSPGEQVFARAGRLIRAMLASPTSPAAKFSADELVKYCESIAAASGGILGLNKVSAEERAVLAQLANDLTGRQG
jgi:hypothetical protein